MVPCCYLSRLPVLQRDRQRASQRSEFALHPLIPAAAGVYFGTSNHDVIKDPRVQVVFDDARHFMLVNQEKFDVITSDPIHPWVKGAAALYSKEYFDLCKEHLKPGGVITQWVPLYESNLQAVKSEVATFFASFPHGSLWCNDDNGQGYDIGNQDHFGSNQKWDDTLAKRVGTSV